MNDLDAVVFFGIVVDDFAGIISRAVVDKNNFEVLVCLAKDGVQAGFKIFFGVINWDDD